MKSQKEIIIGSGLSSFVYFKKNIKKKIKILTNSDARVIKAKTFMNTTPSAEIQIFGAVTLIIKDINSF